MSVVVRYIKCFTHAVGVDAEQSNTIAEQYIDNPAPRGKEVVIRIMVHSDHSGDEADRRSHTGYMIYVKMALIDWLSKNQATVEEAIFGSKFVAMTHGVETLHGIRYKLCMLGVPIDGPT